MRASHARQASRREWGRPRTLLMPFVAWLQATCGTGRAPAGTTDAQLPTTVALTAAAAAALEAARCALSAEMASVTGLSSTSQGPLLVLVVLVVPLPLLVLVSLLWAGLLGPSAEEDSVRTRSR